MMILIVAFLALLAMPVSAAAQVHAADCAKQPSGKPFSLVLTTKTPKVTLGSVPEFAVTITNCSGKTLNISAGATQYGPLDTSFHVDITDPKGNRVSPGDYHKFKPGEVYTGTTWVSQMLPPGKEWTETAGNVSWSYKFDEVGKYRIQVTRKMHERVGGMVLKSNVITITVTKRQAPPGPPPGN